MLLLRVAKQFEKYKIPYALVGGHAVAFYGAVRGTLDLDFIIKWNLKNLKNIKVAFKEIGLESRLPINAQSVFDFRQEYINNKNLIAWNFFNPLNFMEQIDIIITSDLEHKKIKKFHLNNQTVNVLGLDDLIRMKEKAGREQDKIDILALKKIHEKK